MLARSKERRRLVDKQKQCQSCRWESICSLMHSASYRALVFTIPKPHLVTLVYFNVNVLGCTEYLRVQTQQPYSSSTLPYTRASTSENTPTVSDLVSPQHDRVCLKTLVTINVSIIFHLRNLEATAAIGKHVSPLSAKRYASHA